MGGHLATSTSEAKNDFLANLYNGWIILGAFKSAGQWQWVTGESWDFVNWRIFAPSNRADETCLASYFGGWNDDTDTFSAPYVCEWDYDLSQGGVISEGQWLNLAPAVVGEDLCAFVSQLQGAVRSGTCSCTLEPQLFSPEGGLWLDLTENNGRLFVDIARSAGLLLNDNGAQVLGSDFVDCKALPQWIAPAGDVAAVAGGMILAAAGNSLFATCTERGFMREVLGSRCLPLSFGYSDFQAAVGLAEQDDSRATFLVNNLSGGAAKTQPIAWSSVYKQFLSVMPLRSFPKSEMPQKIGDPYTPLFLSSGTETITLQNETLTVSKDDAVSGWMCGYDMPPRYNNFSGHFPPNGEDDDEGYESLAAMESAAGVPVNVGTLQTSGVDLAAGTYNAGSVSWKILTIDFNTGAFVQLLEFNAPIMAIVETSLESLSGSGEVSWGYEYWYINFDDDPPHWDMYIDPAEGWAECSLECACNKIVRYEKPTLNIENGRLRVHKPKEGASDSIEYEDVYYDLPSNVQSLPPDNAPHFVTIADRHSVRGAEPSAGVHFFLFDNNAIFSAFLQFVNPDSYSTGESIYLHTLAYLLDRDVYRVYSLRLHPDVLDIYSEAQRSLAQ